MLQCAVVYCSRSRMDIDVCCSVLQSVAYKYVLQCVALCCSMLNTDVFLDLDVCYGVLRCVVYRSRGCLS